ncbi:MAG: hypothetical protein ACP5UA_03790 [Candidatus Hydrogenedens sp.]
MSVRVLRGGKNVFRHREHRDTRRKGRRNRSTATIQITCEGNTKVFERKI